MPVKSNRCVNMYSIACPHCLYVIHTLSFSRNSLNETTFRHLYPTNRIQARYPHSMLQYDKHWVISRIPVFILNEDLKDLSKYTWIISKFSTKNHKCTPFYCSTTLMAATVKILSSWQTFLHTYSIWKLVIPVLKVHLLLLLPGQTVPQKTSVSLRFSIGSKIQIIKKLE